MAMAPPRMTAAHELSSDSKCVDGAPSHTRRSTRKNQKRLEERQNWGGPKKFDTLIIVLCPALFCRAASRRLWHRDHCLSCETCQLSFQLTLNVPFMVERIYLISTSQRFMVEAVTLLHGRSQTKVIGMPEENFFQHSRVHLSSGRGGLRALCWA